MALYLDVQFCQVSLRTTYKTLASPPGSPGADTTGGGGAGSGAERTAPAPPARLEGA